MSKLFSKIAGFFTSRTLVGMDKAGNRYFTRQENVDGIMKEKRWVIFKGEQEPTSVPVEWICWLNGQRKKAPTPEELLAMEANRERVKLNVARLKKEEEEQKAKWGSIRHGVSTGKVGGPDLKSFIQQFPASSTEGDGHAEASDAVDGMRNSKETKAEKIILPEDKHPPESSEPMGSGESFKPGTWLPPS